MDDRSSSRPPSPSPTADRWQRLGPSCCSSTVRPCRRRSSTRQDRRRSKSASRPRDFPRSGRSTREISSAGLPRAHRRPGSSRRAEGGAGHSAVCKNLQTVPKQASKTGCEGSRRGTADPDFPGRLRCVVISLLPVTPEAAGSSPVSPPFPSFVAADEQVEWLTVGRMKSSAIERAVR
jgi:hypothetical protein